MTDERRTNGELADALEEEVCGRRDYPESYDEGLTNLYAEAATALREMEGTRIEGQAYSHGDGHVVFVEESAKRLKFTSGPAILILTDPREKNDAKQG